jgi:segregation and condensation protein A
VSATTRYTVRLDAFEGPLDLLLHLVKSNEVDIYNLPIATVTDQYLEYVDMFQELNLDVAGEYLVMAATLMYLKSRLLLPRDDDDDDDMAEDDPATDLVRQLAEYQRYKEAAEELTDRARLGRDLFRREPSPPSPEEMEDPGYKPVDLAQLLEALRHVLSQAAARKPHTVAAEDYSVADAVRRMVNLLRNRERLDFRYLFESGAPRGLVIATFCGLLEMIKMHIVQAEQRTNDETIYLRLVDDKVDDAVGRLVETYGQGELHAHHHQDPDEPYHEGEGDNDNGNGVEGRD